MTATNGYVAISRRALDLEDYIDIARRHAGWIIGPALLGLALSVVIAFLLPNTYKSEAMMQITPAQISEALVPSTLNQQLTERIIQMENEILSHQSLSAIIQDPRLNLYPEERASGPLEDVLETMRKRDIHISITSMPGSTAKKASAFSISFEYPNRFLAQQTVQALITRFEDANQNSQRTQQNIVKEFVGDELTQAKANLDRLNDQLARFRAQNDGRLPEQTTMNMASFTSLQNEVSSVVNEINRLSQDRVAMEAHLSTLKNQLDVVGMFALETPASSSPVVRQNEDLVALEKQIAAGESTLQQYLQTYTETYPDVRDLRKRLGVLKTERDDLLARQRQDRADEAAKPKEPVKKATNYQVAQSQTTIQGEITRTEALLKNNESQREYKLKEEEKLNREIAAAREKLAATSGIEARYQDILRDQDNAVKKYQDLVRKQEMTAQNGEMIQRKAGENLDVLDSPTLPVKPIKPRRWMIVGAGFAISFVLGIALAGLQEAKDASLKNLKDVRAYTNLPVLSSIPLLENTLVVKRKRRLTYLAWFAAIILGIVAVCASLLYYYSVTAKS